MADPVSAGVAMGTNLATSAIVVLIKVLMKRIRTVARCKSEGEKLVNKLESIKPDVEDMEHLVEGLRKLKPNTKQTELRIVERWLQKLRAELLAASASVDQCSKNVFSSGVNQYSLSKKISAHIMKIEKLEDQLPNLSVSLQILRNLVTERRSQVEFPEVFANWVKEKDDILRRADVTKRHEAASCYAQVHSSHGGPAIYTTDASQHSSSYMYQPHSHGGPAIYTGDASQHSSPYMYHPSSHGGPAIYTGDASQHSSPYMYHPSSHGDLAIYTEDAIQYSYPYINQPSPQFDVSSPQVNPPCSQFINHPCPQFPPSPFMNHPGSQVHPSYNHS